MPALLISHACHALFGAELTVSLRRLDPALELLVLPAEQDARLPAEAIERIELAFFSQDIFPSHTRQFFSAVRKAPRLRWMHAFVAGMDDPIYAELLARGARLTSSVGTTAVPIAQTAITGMLMLARGFPHWLRAQGERRWAPVRLQASPRDLPGQTVLVYGMGHVGSEFARLAKALGMRIIGVRHRPLQPDDPVDEMHPPAALDSLLPRADWLMVACALTPETRGVFSAGRLARLPRGAHILNIARGECIAEAAMTAMLQDGRLGGAYLDVFEKEPLTEASLLWSLPNVLVTPHNATSALGNERRVFDLFTRNLDRWYRGETLLHEVQP
jgi:phosphoglycerate dehydrogenase-like enzyme